MIENFFSSTTQNTCLFSCCQRENMIDDVLLFLFSRACCIFTQSRPQTLKLCRPSQVSKCLSLTMRWNLLPKKGYWRLQCEELARQKEIEHRCCNFLFNSSTFDFQVGAILKTLDKVNSLSSIQALSFGENEVGKFCVLQIFGAPCFKTLIDHKKSSTTNWCFASVSGHYRARVYFSKMRKKT